jgi:hypothetical protein
MPTGLKKRESLSYQVSETLSRYHYEQPPALVIFGGRERSPGLAPANATLAE